MKFETERIIDSNGTKYRVGWDEHGWFSIQHIQLHEITEGTREDAETVEFEGEEFLFQTIGEYPTTSFTPSGTDELIAAIKDQR